MIMNVYVLISGTGKALLNWVIITEHMLFNKVHLKRRETKAEHYFLKGESTLLTDSQPSALPILSLGGCGPSWGSPSPHRSCWDLSSAAMECYDLVFLEDIYSFLRSKDKSYTTNRVSPFSPCYQEVQCQIQTQAWQLQVITVYYYFPTFWFSTSTLLYMFLF